MCLPLQLRGDEIKAPSGMVTFGSPAEGPAAVGDGAFYFRSMQRFFALVLGKVRHSGRESKSAAQ